MVQANTDRLSARSERKGKPPDTSSAHSCHTKQTFPLHSVPVTPNKHFLYTVFLSHQTFPLHSVPVTPNKHSLDTVFLSLQTLPPHSVLVTPNKHFLNTVFLSLQTLPPHSVPVTPNISSTQCSCCSCHNKKTLPLNSVVSLLATVHRNDCLFFSGFILLRTH